MRSITAYTEEIDDLDAAAESLIAQTKSFAFAQNSLAILFAEEDADLSALYELLKQEWDFPVIGCSAMAMFTGKIGYCRGGISALLLTADDCRFTAGITGELDHGNYRDEIERAFGELEARHGEEAKLCLCYYGSSVHEQVLTGSNLLAALDAASGGLPVYGGAASDSLSFQGYHAFCNGRTVQNGLALALISGNVSPRFVRVNSSEHTASFSYEITHAEGTVVYQLGDGTFLDALKREKLRVDHENIMGAYLLSPFLVTLDKGNGDRVEVTRILEGIDRTTGAGKFLGFMPEGATLNIGLINHEDVCLTVEKAFAQIFRELAKPGSSCSTLLCTSCSARYLALINTPSKEAEIFMGRLPEGLSLAGFYSYGECCPVRGNETGTLYNLYHNFTFTILAL
jgi:hypothetical protein